MIALAIYSRLLGAGKDLPLGCQTSARNFIVGGARG